jgi:hypothetical protein
MQGEIVHPDVPAQPPHIGARKPTDRASGKRPERLAPYPRVMSPLSRPVRGRVVPLAATRPPRSRSWHRGPRALRPRLVTGMPLSLTNVFATKGRTLTVVPVAPTCAGAFSKGMDALRPMSTPGAAARDVGGAYVEDLPRKLLLPLFAFLSGQGSRGTTKADGVVRTGAK